MVQCGGIIGVDAEETGPNRNPQRNNLKPTKCSELQNYSSESGGW